MYLTCQTLIIHNHTTLSGLHTSRIDILQLDQSRGMLQIMAPSWVYNMYELGSQVKRCHNIPHYYLLIFQPDMTT